MFHGLNSTVRFPFLPGGFEHLRHLTQLARLIADQSFWDTLDLPAELQELIQPWYVGEILDGADVQAVLGYLRDTFEQLPEPLM